MHLRLFLYLYSLYTLVSVAFCVYFHYDTYYIYYTHLSIRLSDIHHFHAISLLAQVCHSHIAIDLGLFLHHSIVHLMVVLLVLINRVIMFLRYCILHFSINPQLVRYQRHHHHILYRILHRSPLYDYPFLRLTLALIVQYCIMIPYVNVI